MEPSTASEALLAITRAKAKLLEYSVPMALHFQMPNDPTRLFVLAVGILGDEAAAESNGGYTLPESPPTRFSAYFFDAYLRSGIDHVPADYALLLASASYYLCNLAGSSQVLAKEISETFIDDEDCAIRSLLHSLLFDQRDRLDKVKGGYAQISRNILKLLNTFFESGEGQQELERVLDLLRNDVYSNGSPRQLLLADLVSAISLRRVSNSTWLCIPGYTGIPKETWKAALSKKTSVRELWPAQHLLGKESVFAGTSAVIQMPTSSGKSRAIEFMIRSAFLSNRTSVAVIVAPFRALCHEIRRNFQRAFANEQVTIDEFSDILQMDVDLFGEIFDYGQSIVVVTPEKLLYLLRQNPELAASVGVVVLDEGHQFDSGTRGVTYELLITSLKAMLPEDAQKVLISAVISNAKEVDDWLNSGSGRPVQATGILPTYRTIAFSSWQEERGLLNFVDSSNAGRTEFSVPEVLERQTLKLRKRERKERFFPEPDDGGDIALYLTTKLVKNGGVAIFCGQKSTANKLAGRLVDVFERGVIEENSLSDLTMGSDNEEISRLTKLYAENLGPNELTSKAAALGAFTHHANTPTGIRQAVEYALAEGMTRVVICTSTLAQGVNLPIRYLLVTGTQQGPERISVRDFQNLIGRAGRADKHTEGSVIFTKPSLYDNRDWRWRAALALLDPASSEPCASSILSAIAPIERDDKKESLSWDDQLILARIYSSAPERFDLLPSEIAQAHEGYSVSGIAEQIGRRRKIFAAIESFLMAYWDDSEAQLDRQSAAALARATLAHHLANESDRAVLVELFQILADNVTTRVELGDRAVFGRSLFGAVDSLAICDWVTKKAEDLEATEDDNTLLEVLWPLLWQLIGHKHLKNCSNPATMKDLLVDWVSGVSFAALHTRLEQKKAKRVTPKRQLPYSVGHVVDICENGYAFQGTMVLGAVVEWLDSREAEHEVLVARIKSLQKSLRYGLPGGACVVLHELGFSDRVVAQRVAAHLTPFAFDKDSVIQELQQQKARVTETLYEYPTLFATRLRRILS